MTRNEELLREALKDCIRMMDYISVQQVQRHLHLNYSKASAYIAEVTSIARDTLKATEEASK